MENNPDGSQEAPSRQSSKANEAKCRLESLAEQAHAAWRAVPAAALMHHSASSHDPLRMATPASGMSQVISMSSILSDQEAPEGGSEVLLQDGSVQIGFDPLLSLETPSRPLRSSLSSYSIESTPITISDNLDDLFTRGS